MHQSALGLIPMALRLKIFLELNHVHVIGLFIDIDEIRPAANLRNGFCGRNKRVGYGEDNFALPYSAGQQREHQGFGATRNADTVFGIAVLSEVPFEILHHRPAYKTAGLDGRAENRKNLFLELRMWSDKI